jgi:hypothetical protein
MRCRWKAGLGEPALAEVVRALARQQAFPEQALRALECASLAEQPGPGNQDVLHVIGMVQKREALPPDTEPDDVAVFGSEPLQRLEAPTSQRTSQCQS